MRGDVLFGVAEIGLTEKLSIENLELEEWRVAPRKSDIDIEDFSICWLPWRIDSSGIAELAWQDKASLRQRTSGMRMA